MESALYGIYTLVFVSEILLVRFRFLIRQQLVRKYRTPALSMKYSLYTEKCDTRKINVFFLEVLVGFVVVVAFQLHPWLWKHNVHYE